MLNALLGMPNTHLILTISSQDVFLLFILKIAGSHGLNNLPQVPKLKAERLEPSSKAPIFSDNSDLLNYTTLIKLKTLSGSMDLRRCRLSPPNVYLFRSLGVEQSGPHFKEGKSDWTAFFVSEERSQEEEGGLGTLNAASGWVGYQ